MSLCFQCYFFPTLFSFSFFLYFVFCFSFSFLLFLFRFFSFPLSFSDFLFLHFFFFIFTSICFFLSCLSVYLEFSQFLTEDNSHKRVFHPYSSMQKTYSHSHTHTQRHIEHTYADEIYVTEVYMYKEKYETTKWFSYHIFLFNSGTLAPESIFSLFRNNALPDYAFK